MESQESEVGSQIKKNREERTVRFDVNEPSLLVDLKPLAEKRKVGFDWDGQLYPKAKRAQRPELDGLVRHRAALEVMAKHCPNGHPSTPGLRRVLVELDKKHEIFNVKDLSDANRHILATDACHMWQTMLKHSVDLKKETVFFADRSLIWSGGSWN